MKRGVYYNENDPFAAAWLRELIKAGQIAPGEVDDRSIVDVRPHEVKGFAQCHWFAGIGVWSLALRSAGWADGRQIWSGSCPCQPFSASGRGKGFDDERHLWPHWFHLIDECRPPVLVGEQVASKDGLQWLDLVQADLEGAGYASGAVDLCVAGIGAPHIRQRLWWVGKRLEQPASDGWGERRAEPVGRGAVARRGDDRLADADAGVAELSARQGSGSAEADGGRPQREPSGRGDADGVADAVRGRAGDGPGEGLGAQAAADGGDGDLPGERLRAGIEGASGGLVDGQRTRLEGHAGHGHAGDKPGWFGSPSRRSVAEAGRARGLADTGHRGGPTGLAGTDRPAQRGGQEDADTVERDGVAGGLADADRAGQQVVAAARLRGRRQGEGGGGPAEGDADGSPRHDADGRGEHGGLADAEGGEARPGLRDRGSREERRLLDRDDSADVGVADPGGAGIRDRGRGADAGAAGGAEGSGPERQRLRDDAGDDDGGAAVGVDDGGWRGPVNGFWRDADWLFCRDGKWRPVEPGTFPLAPGTPGRVGLLRGYGNSINAPIAQAFIESVMEVL